MNESTSAQETEAFLHHHIPLTRTMGLRVLECAENNFVCEAPVALNHNHLQTAFGGSINAVATLAAYGLLWMQLRGFEAHIVVAASAIKFLRPVREIIHARCVAPAGDLETFRTLFAEKRRARISLRVQVRENGVTAAEFQGAFVAQTGAR